jgi:hypothetical protein
VDTGSFQNLEKTVYSQAVNDPTGPYPLCSVLGDPNDWKEIARVIHPSIPRGASNRNSFAKLSGDAAKEYQNSSEILLNKVLENKDSETLFNVSYPINQTVASASGTYEHGPIREYLVFPFSLETAEFDSKTFFCSCGFTNIPEGVRNNTLVELYFETASQGGEISQGHDTGIRLPILAMLCSLVFLAVSHGL